MHGDLKNSRFLVIGGSSGIGLAVAMAATNAGAAVTIASRSRAKLDSALADSRLTARGRQLDITDHLAVVSFSPTKRHGITLSYPLRRQRAVQCGS